MANKSEHKRNKGVFQAEDLADREFCKIWGR